MTTQDPTEQAPSDRAQSPAFKIAIAFFLLLAVLTFALYWRTRDNAEQLLQAANRAFLARDFVGAQRFATRVLTIDPMNDAAALLAGRAAEGQGKLEVALEFLRQVSDNDPRLAASARIQAGELLSGRLKRLSAAVSEFRRALELDPENPIVNERLAFLLGLEGNNREATPLRLRLIQLNKFGPIHLLLLCMGDYIFENPELIEEYRVSIPDDPLVLIALARGALDKQDPARAEELLRPVVVSHPDLLEAQVRFGQALFEQHKLVAFQQWHTALPRNAEDIPGLWFLRASWARQQNDTSGAVRCYLETLDRDPNHQAANYHLAQLLLMLGEEQQASRFLARSQKLQKLDTAVRAAWSGGGAENPMRQAAQEAESLGLIWESFGWHTLARQKFPNAEWAIEGGRRLQPKLSGLPLTRTVPGANPAETLDRSNYPLPNWTTGRAELKSAQVIQKPSPFGPVSFVDKAVDAGLNFQYFNSSDPLHPDRKMQEFTGGGVAILDFDADGWPDVHLTQGSDWPPRSQEFQYLDRQFRNLGNGTFQDVTSFANLNENGFSQGVAVGDFDNDGFPDLYVGNIGANRFFRNNGDGTFDDITVETGTAGNAWTTSCLLADLNHDGWPDLYVVNYLAGPEPLERICHDETGHPRSCMPRVFDAAQDQLYVNLRDGTFRNVSQSSGIMVPDGKGLGIVAADFDGAGKLNLFVANDAVSNFYFVNQTPPGGDVPTFIEQGIPLGLALNADGRAQACMGVAAGNLENDHRLALFVTNFHNEPNTLYHEQSGRLFVDDTRRWGLYDASIPMVGFGTQFLDAELDGFLDLILTNGEVDDSRDLGQTYQMRPQYFRNPGTGPFVELFANSLGPYFDGKYLGRGLARVDWNRDGRDDIVVSHLDAPAALLTNTTQPAGHFVAFQLRATTTSRDAIGATVTVRIGDRQLVRQLIAGDGYHASNERILRFGLGKDDHIDELTVSWPSGLKQEFREISIDSQFLIIENVSRMFQQR